MLLSNQRGWQAHKGLLRFKNIMLGKANMSSAISDLWSAEVGPRYRDHIALNTGMCGLQLLPGLRTGRMACYLGPRGEKQGKLFPFT